MTSTKKFRYLFGFLLAFGAVMAMSASAWAFVKGEVTADRVNIRTEASLGSDVVYMVDRGQPINIMNAVGDFYHISLNTESNLYIAKQYVQITEIVGTVINDNTPLLDKPVQENGIPLTTVNKTFAVSIQFQDENGYYVDCSGRDFYVEKQNLAVPNIVEIPWEEETPIAPPPPMPMSMQFGESPAPGTPIAGDIISFAKQYLGVRYRYGSTNPNNGFDCSGFVTYVLKNFGVSVSRSSASMANNGVEVSKDSLQQGDLIFFATTNGSSRISHVGMYIGDGQFIHSSTWGEGVVITDLSEPYYTRCYVKARRVL